VTYWVPQIGFLGTRNQLKNGFKTSRTRLFFIFCQTFVLFLVIFKGFTVLSAMLHLKKSSIMPKVCQKIWRKALFHLNFNPFLQHGTSNGPSLVIICMYVLKSTCYISPQKIQQIIAAILQDLTTILLFWKQQNNNNNNTKIHILVSCIASRIRVPIKYS